MRLFHSNSTVTFRLRTTRRLAPVLGVLSLVLAICAVSPSASLANLNVFYSQVGHLKMSVDANGSNTGSGVIEVQKPIGATVEKAFLFAASTGFEGFEPPDGEVSLDGHAVNWNPAYTISNGIQSYNVAADVTGLIGPTIETAQSGEIDVTVEEADPLAMDGEILAVVFDDPATAENTIYMMYGAQATTGDHFAIGLTEPVKPSTALTMGLGISYGFQPAGQDSSVVVNGSKMTSSAGGQDDCNERSQPTPSWGACENGTLITVGGIGDSTDDPPDPEANDQDCANAAGEPAPRCDDELYNLKPFVSTGSTSIGIDTVNPSNDDNILFADLDLGAAGIVGEGIVLGPTGTRSQVGNFHEFKALIQDADGHPEVGKQVTIHVLNGPGAGFTEVGPTGADGTAVFGYISNGVGTNEVEATVEGAGGTTLTSNRATQTWAPAVDGTFGGEWPYEGGQLQLHYSYGGDHRYLGNVVQGAVNWDQVGTNVNLTPWPGGSSLDQIPFVDVSTQEDWWGMTVFAEQCTTCGFTRNTIELNRRTLDPESDAQRTKVATHELGHALGLEHPYQHVPSSVPSVMWQGSLGGSVHETPQPYDINRVNGMYP